MENVEHLKVKKHVTVGGVILKILIALILIIDIYPIFWMITASFKTPNEFSAQPSFSLPHSLYLVNYVNAWTTGQMYIFYKNSIIDTLVSLVLICVFSVTASFAIAKMKWRFKNAYYNMMIAGISVPVTIVLIPLFIIYNQAHLLNTYWSLIFAYTAFGLSLSIYLLVSYFSYVPNEIMESAVIDGCNIYSVLFKIVLPLVRNAIITVVVLQFFFKWNDLIFSMTFISDTGLKTIQTGLMYFSDEFGQKDWGAIFASISIAVVPTLILYAALNKKVIEGMTAGAVKG
jgi:ABC-type sugar transport system, permease component